MIFFKACLLGHIFGSSRYLKHYLVYQGFQVVPSLLKYILIKINRCYLGNIMCFLWAINFVFKEEDYSCMVVSHLFSQKHPSSLIWDDYTQMWTLE